MKRHPAILDFQELNFSSMNHFPLRNDDTSKSDILPSGKIQMFFSGMMICSHLNSTKKHLTFLEVFRAFFVEVWQSAETFKSVRSGKFPLFSPFTIKTHNLPFLGVIYPIFLRIKPFIFPWVLGVQPGTTKKNNTHNRPGPLCGSKFPCLTLR